MIGTYVAPKEIVTEPKPIPIDVNPDNANGTIAIYDSKWPASNSKTERFVRRLYHEAAKAWLRAGGVLYRSHFDTCPGYPIR